MFRKLLEITFILCCSILNVCESAILDLNSIRYFSFSCFGKYDNKFTFVLQPNCVAEVVTFEKEQKIIIISNRKVEKGEEVGYFSYSK